MQRATLLSIIIFIAQALLLSACSSHHQPAPVVNLTKTASTPAAKNNIKRNLVNSKYYMVKKGDTLYSIAFSAGKDFKEIARFNNIPKPYSIYPGQRLSLISTKATVVKNTNKPTPKPRQDNKKQTVETTKKSAYSKNVVTKNTQTKPSGKSNNEEVSKWIWPTKGKVVSKFSLGAVGNKGIDISGQKGDPIIATANGKVVYTGDALRGYGKLIIVKHSEDYLSAYAHNNEILVKEQQLVKAGQIIARKGNSGTEQVMLHFEIRYKGKSVDPLRYLPKNR